MLGNGADRSLDNIAALRGRPTGETCELQKRQTKISSHTMVEYRPQLGHPTTPFAQSSAGTQLCSARDGHGKDQISIFRR
jgi:hypothetical protein